MRLKPALVGLGIMLFLVFTAGGARGQAFTAERISGHIYIVKDPDGESQLVMTSEKGLVVFNTFWSSLTARKYKAEIGRLLGREDFFLTVNMVDRLDMFGGNSAYLETTIIGQQNLLDKYRGKEKEAKAEIQNLIDMWRWKETVSRERLKTHAPGSDEEMNERNWMLMCKQRADDLEQGFSLTLPDVVYRDRKSLDLGDITLELIWFGRTGYDGMSVAVVPEEKTAIIPGFIMHSQHLAPYPFSSYAKLDVPRWIEVLEEILEGDKAVERVVCGMNDVWSRERAHTHLVYIRELWNKVKEAEAAGRSLDQIQSDLSLDGEFAFVKDMQVYRDNGDDWIRPQHRCHVRVFFLQHKNLASEILKKEIKDSPQAAIGEAIRRLRKLHDRGSDVYFDEASVNDLGYELMNSDRIGPAIEVLQLNAEFFPASANVYDSLAEAYMKSGDKAKAIELYRKSLELDPGNDNAKEKLKELGEG
jgi:hypothetical protein